MASLSLRRDTWRAPTPRHLWSGYMWLLKPQSGAMELARGGSGDLRRPVAGAGLVGER